jgi:hypothetical protein
MKLFGAVVLKDEGLKPEKLKGTEIAS